MKLYQIEHINEDHNKNRVMGMELKFTHSIDSCNGRLWKAEKQPDDWDHVKRLTHMLFLAWNDKNPIEGVVYLGELVGEKSDKEKFCEFFEKFNGFAINDAQKGLFDNRNSKYHMGTRGRRGGVSTFLMTLAAWEANNGKQVAWVHSTHYLLDRMKREYILKCINMNICPTPIYYLVANDQNRCISFGCDIGLYDCSSGKWQLDWWSECEYRCDEYSMALKTTEYEY